MKIRGREIVVFLIFCINSLFGQDYPITDRSLAYTTAFTLPANVLQSESGYVNVFSLDKVDGVDLNLFSLNLRYGLNSFSEIRVGTNWQQLTAFDDNESGLSGLNISAKIALKTESNLPAVFLQTGMITNLLQSDVFDTKRLSPYTKLIFEKYLNDIFILGANLGYRWGEAEQQAATYAITLRTAISEHVTLYSEFYGVNDLAGPSRNFVDCALEFWILDRTVIDFVYGKGISTFSDGGFWSIGFSRRW